jgi:hypothetical protein
MKMKENSKQVVKWVKEEIKQISSEMSKEETKQIL